MSSQQQDQERPTPSRQPALQPRGLDEPHIAISEAENPLADEQCLRQEFEETEPTIVNVDKALRELQPQLYPPGSSGFKNRDKYVQLALWLREELEKQKAGDSSNDDLISKTGREILEQCRMTAKEDFEEIKERDLENLANEEQDSKKHEL